MAVAVRLDSSSQASNLIRAQTRNGKMAIGTEPSNPKRNRPSFAPFQFTAARLSQDEDLNGIGDFHTSVAGRLETLEIQSSLESGPETPDEESCDVEEDCVTVNDGDAQNISEFSVKSSPKRPAKGQLPSSPRKRARPTNQRSDVNRLATPLLHRPHTSAARSTEDRSSHSLILPAPPPRKRRKSPPPCSTLPPLGSSIATDSDSDDGTGINGIGFRPTPLQAYARAQKRRQQVLEWKAREANDERKRRSDRRRGSGHADGRAEGGGSDRRAVRFDLSSVEQNGHVESASAESVIPGPSEPP